ncbi:hypothetical protein GQ53DRAFT_690725 [Thozetella sp. PMI_491]|nr:hypothetical protein GQ53DRAFT_690725 [Thozetella sp. PMI_491]
MMLKPSHRKTRKGAKCAECRRRHIRCDLRRPGCTNCAQADLVCSFRGAAASLDSSGARTNCFQSSGRVVRGSASHCGQVQQPVQPYELFGDPSAPLGLALGGSLINMAHLELFHYFTTMPSPFLAGGEATPGIQKRIAVHAAFSTPYLMYETLAFAARRRSLEHPSDRAQFYEEQATLLQTRALSLFRSARPEPNQHNCIAMFVFSGMLGIHLLADTLSNRGQDLESILAPFVRYLAMHRSLVSLVTGQWPMLMNTELRSILSWGKQPGFDLPAQKPNFLYQLICEANNLSPKSAEACHEAIKYLQWAMDDECGPHQRQQRQMQMVFTWPLILSQPYTGLLIARRPEALIILAHYGVLLHRCRPLWVVGDSGSYLVRVISASIEPKWMPYLLQAIEVVDS